MKKKKKNKFINLFKKLKKTTPGFHFLYIIVLVLFVMSSILLSYSLILLNGIETTVRTLLIIIMITYLFIYFFIGSALLITKKHKILVGISILTLIFTAINAFGYYYIEKTYTVVDNISKEEVIYTSSLLSLDKDKEIKNIGILKDENSIEGFILPQEYIAKNSKKWKITNYENNDSLIKALLEKEVDAIFITSNYKLLYSTTYPELENAIEIDSISKKMNNNDTVASTGKDITEPFTILLLGVDSEYDGLANNAAFNGDSIMLISFNPKTLSATVFSIPRDTYVPIACNNNKKHKINSAAAYGTKCMIDTIQNLTDITIDYFVKINFKGVVNLVDALDGIDAFIDEPDFKKNGNIDCKGMVCEQNSSRQFGEHTVYIKPGNQHLNGEQALAYARNRHQWALSDFKRVEHQQAIVTAIANKAKTIRNINTFYKVLNAVSNNMDTNMETNQMLNFYNVGKNILLKSKFSEGEFINIQKTFLSGYDQTIYQGYDMYTYQYYEESLNEIVDAMKINLGLKKPEIIKTFSFSVNEEYTVPVVGRKYTGVRKDETLPNFVNQKIGYVEEWVSSRNINLIKNITESNACIHNSILSQDIHSGVLVSNINNLTVNVCQNITKPETETPNNEPNNDDSADKNENNQNDILEKPLEDLIAP